MKRLTQIILLTTLIFNFLYSQALDGDRIKRNIFVLGRKIEQISILVERYKNDRAANLIKKAKNEFSTATNLLEQWFALPRSTRLRNTEKLATARVHYNLSNKLADQAARLLLFKPTANLKTELERLIHRAESAAHDGSDNSELRYFLNKARAFHREALNAFSHDQYLKGHEFLRIAVYFAEKTISLAQSGQQNGTRLQKFEEQNKNIQILLNEALRFSTENDVIKELQQNAQNYLKRAKQAYNNGKLKRAYSQLRIAERLAYRIIDLAGNKNNSLEEKVKEDYQSLGRYLSSVRSELESSGQRSKLLDKADQLYTKAGHYISSAQYQKAATNLKLSQRMGLRAFKKTSSSSRPDVESLQSRLNEVQHLLQLQEGVLSSQKNDANNLLYGQADKFFNDAKRAYSQQSYAQTAYLLNLSLRILNRNEKVLKQKPQNISSQKIEKDLLRIERVFSRLNTNPSLDAKNKIKLNYLAELLEKARREFDTKNYIVSAELLFIIQQQISTMLNN